MAVAYRQLTYFDLESRPMRDRWMPRVAVEYAYRHRRGGDAAGARDLLASLLQLLERGLGQEHPRTLTIRNEFVRWTG
jgi:hypothetical protein